MAFAGGGPLGGIYELGTLRALEDSFDGLDFTDLQVYVGVSSGAFIAASLANGLSPAQMCRIFINSAAPEHPFKPELFVRPAFAEYWERAARIPGVLWQTIKELARHPLDLSASAYLGYLAELVPSGLLDNDRLAHFLQDVFSVPGRTDDFRQLRRKLYVVAVDLDTGMSVRFGAPGHDHVPISRAVQASAALPGLYPPVEIDGRYYVDGALRRTLHASAAMNEGVDLMLGLNPLVPYDGTRPDFTRRDSLARRGLPTVLSQTFRALIQSRMEVGLQKYTTQYPDIDLLVMEPDRNDERMFFTNVFSYSSRHELCEHAYQVTRGDLRRRAEELEPLLARHGISLRHDRLNDPARRFTTGLSRDSLNPLANSLNDTLDQLARKVSGL